MQVNAVKFWTENNVNSNSGLKKNTEKLRYFVYDRDSKYEILLLQVSTSAFTFLWLPDPSRMKMWGYLIAFQPPHSAALIKTLKKPQVLLVAVLLWNHA